MSLPPDFLPSQQSMDAAARLKLAWDAARARAFELDRYISTLVLSVDNETDLTIAQEELSAIRLVCERLLRKLSEIDGSK